jgi:hypothetical protein
LPEHLRRNRQLGYQRLNVRLGGDLDGEMGHCGSILECAGR